MKPKLSIVIGANNARTSIRDCLTSLENQKKDQNVEIIVVDNSTDGTTEIISQQFPNVNLLRAPASDLIPQLWEIGINQSTGNIVAITTAHCVPEKNWIEEILKAHDSSPYPGIGGAIENDKSAGLVEWAIFFCRYSRYMLPFPERTANEIAGDNASYKRWVLDRYKQARRQGFWEPTVHAKLRKDGLQLLIKPTIVVYHKKSFSLLGFIRQRFWHGKQFGKARTVSLSGIKRIIYVLLSPLIPLLFLSRITQQVLTKRKHRGKFLLSLPILILFLLGWSTGELIGYLSPSQK